jgi:MYXO-CTERM domain-containing protein
MRYIQGDLDLRRSRSIAARSRLGVALALLIASVSVAGTASAKPFEEYIKPTPTVAPLSSATWGVAGVIPRDISNGIESAKGAGVHPDYYYWDGEIIKATDGKYHMFMSTFSGNTNFGGGWLNSDAYHAISQTNVLGPYVRQDYVYNSGGSSPHKGHNVSAAQLSDGSYVVVVSEIVPFTLYKSSSLDGPWTGCSPQTDVGGSNISFIERHDGKFEITERSGGLAISDTLCGHYVRQQPKTTYTAHSNSVYPVRTSIPGVSNPTYAYEEDPHIWRSGGTYHIIYSGSGDRVGWHVYSPDGITGWKDNGYAWSGRDYQKIFCYEGSTTCTAWYKMERPGVVLEDGHPTHITWAVSDVDKDNQVLPGTNHGTKVIVVPFDGVAFDTDFGNGSAGGSGGSADGGTAGSGGAGGGTGAGGKTGTDGGVATGGRSGSGGASGGTTSGTTGGTSGSGGVTSSSVSSGGMTSSTGGAGSGGNSASSGGRGGSSSSAGGASASGGTASGSGGTSSSGTSGGKGGSTTSTTAGGTSSSGCSCSVGSSGSHGALEPSFLLIALGILLARRRTRGNRGSR